MYLHILGTTCYLINMTFINNVHQESGNKTTVSIHFVNLFPFHTKIKTSILLRVGIEKPAQKNPIKPGLKCFFFNCLFFEVFKSILYQLY